MKKRAFACVAAAMLCCALCAAGCSGGGFLAPPEPQVDVRAENAFSRTVVVAMDCDYEPYSFWDEQDEPSGFDVELVNMLANRAGFNVEVRLMCWSDCIEAVRAGEADLVTSMDYKPLEHPDFVFSRAVQNDPFVCFGAEDFEEATDLAGARLATIADSGAIDGVLAPYKLLEGTVLYSTYTEALQSVADGRSDYAIARYSVGRRLVAKHALSSVRAVGPSLLDNPLCIGASAENEALVRELDAALVELEAEGALGDLKEKWLGSYVRFIRLEDVVSAYGAQALIIALLAAAIVFGALVSLYRKRLAATRREREAALRLQQYQKLIIDAAHGLYESICELNLTSNRAGSPETERLLERLGLAKDVPLDEALREIARRQVKDEHVQGYLDTFCQANVERAFERGENALSYDFLATADGGATYRWMRVNARVFRHESDGSLRMIVFRENIEDEKRREQLLLDQAKRDMLTGLLNKAATEAAIRACLAEDAPPGRAHALLVIDIDDFKTVNDRYGHALGDKVLVHMATAIESCFRSSDVVGRFGGDEYVAFVKDVPSIAWLRCKLEDVVRRLAMSAPIDGVLVKVGASVGAACYPAAGATYAELFEKADRALYAAKEAGKRGFCIDDGEGA